jgi:hypothetical protein
MPTIKLIAMGGVPWTKSWGIMFLVSFVTIEILVLVGGSKPQKLPIKDDDDEETQRHSTITRDLLEKFDKYLMRLAFVVHIAVLIWAAIDIKPQPSSKEMFPRRRSFEATVLIATSMALGVAHFYVLVLVWLISNAFRILPNLANRPGTHFIFGASYILLWIPAMWFFAQYELTQWDEPAFPSPVWIFIDYGYIALIPGFPLLLFGFIVKISELSCWVGRNLYVMHQCVCNGQSHGGAQYACLVNGLACYPVMFFFLNLILFTAWYANRFDSAGTVIPSWTVVFG